ncbi:MAG: rod shape-determining protein MreC, partial [Thermomicrobiaceae bacterium]|nr:rod shape-determining protein MreC [Thermomicrobiaceae bacterium]
MRSFTVRQTAALVLLFVLTSTTLIFLDQQHALTDVRGSGATLLRPFVAAGGAVARQLAALRG